MATQKYVSDIKTVNWNNQIVYDKLSNLSFLNIMFGPENMERIKQQMGDKAPDMDIKNFIADRDTCSFDMPPIGKIAFHIEEREEPKTIKIVSDESIQFQFKLWIQLLPISNTQCKIRVTLHIELNMMMKMMIGKKLNKGINQITDGIAQIPFGMI
jgi:hypothetical protein